VLLAPVVSTVALLSAHVPGVSQANVVVDVVVDAGGADGGDDNGDVVVEVDAVFARADAARLPDPFVVVTAGGAACPGSPVDAAAVEGDGRALRLQARCHDDGDIVIDVKGLSQLPPEHRLALRAVDERGTHDFLLSPAAAQATLPRPRGRPSAGTIAGTLALAVAAVVVALGARRPRPFVSTLGLALVGCGCGLLLRFVQGDPAVVAAADVAVDVTAVVRFVVAALAVVGVALDPLPRPRPSALALGALVAAGP
jgi:hypothetical protein